MIYTTVSVEFSSPFDLLAWAFMLTWWWWRWWFGEEEGVSIPLTVGSPRYSANDRRHFSCVTLNMRQKSCGLRFPFSLSPFLNLTSIRNRKAEAVQCYAELNSEREA